MNAVTITAYAVQRCDPKSQQLRWAAEVLDRASTHVGETCLGCHGDGYCPDDHRGLGTKDAQELLHAAEGIARHEALLHDALERQRKR